MEPDSTLLLAVQRNANGNAHKLSGLVQVYIDACYLGRVKEALKLKHEIYQELLKS